MRLRVLLPFLLLLASISFAESENCAALTPYGAVPSNRQLQWHKLEAYAFIHFTVNTFTDKEWGYGDEPETVFNPTDFDAEQIVQTVKDAGLKGLILTAKHHDGFCLWPSAYTRHNISASPYRNGHGDIVKEVSDACQKAGIKFGIYLSPWDRNHAKYGSEEYITYYRNQLRELLTQYGPIFEIWFDGANGGDGWYGGASEMRKIDNTTYYDWANTWSIVRELQPQAVIFSDGGPDVRWCGNEKGFVHDPSWATIDAEGNKPGHADPAQLQVGNPGGTHWMPAEVDVSIRPGWFYHKSEDTAVKTPAKLYKIYFESVGRGASLILNLAPDKRGQIPDIDVEMLHKWRNLLDDTFDHDLTSLEGTTVSASSTLSVTEGAGEHYAPTNVTDHDRDSFWIAGSDDSNASLTISFKNKVCFNVVDLREYLPLGQRVRLIALEAWKETEKGGEWSEFARVESVGGRRLVSTESDIVTTKVRVRVLDSAAPAAISEVGFYYGAVRAP